jgi:hypothetical protein
VLPSGGLSLRAGGPGSQAAVTLQLSAPGIVTATVQQQRNGRWVAVGSQTLTATHAGQLQLLLGSRIAGHQLAPGHYRVAVQAKANGQTSQPVNLPLTINPPANGPHGQPRLLSLAVNPHTIVWRKGDRAPTLWLTFLLSRDATLQMSLQARIHGQWRQLAGASTHALAGADRVQLVGRWHGSLVPSRTVRLTVQATAANKASAAETLYVTVKQPCE